MRRAWKVAVTAVLVGAGTLGVASPAWATESPELLGALYEPEEVRTKSQLVASVFATDPDGGALTGTYQWLLDGVAIAGASGTLDPMLAGEDPGPFYRLQATLDLSVAGHGDRGDELSLEYTIQDGVDPALVGETDPITVLNTPPRADVSISPLLPDTNDTLTAAPVSLDPDDEALDFTYEWFRNGKKIPGATDDELDLGIAGHGDKNDEIAVRATGSDGEGSVTVRSNVVGVEKDVGHDLGQFYPNFTLTDQHGDKVSLSDYRGRHVLLVWSTLWCAPSITMSPAIPIVQEILDNAPELPAGFAYLQVEQQNQSLGPTTLAQAQTFADKYGIASPVLHPNGAASDTNREVERIAKAHDYEEEFGAFPTLVFLSPKGKVTRAHFGRLGPNEILDHYLPEHEEFEDLRTKAYDMQVQHVGMTVRIGTSTGRIDEAFSLSSLDLHNVKGMPGRTGGVDVTLVGDREQWDVILDTDGSHDLPRNKPIKIVLDDRAWVTGVQHDPARSTAKLRVETVLGTRSIGVPVSEASNGNLTIGPVTLADRGFVAGDPIRGLSAKLTFDHLPHMP